MAQRGETAWTEDVWLQRGRAGLSHQDPPVRSGWQVVPFFLGKPWCACVCPHLYCGILECSDMMPGIYSEYGRTDENGPGKASVGSG